MSTITFDFRHYYRKGERRESDQIAYQWDLGHVAEIYVPVNATYEIHYCFSDYTQTEDYAVESTTAAEDGGYKLTAHIPNKFFERSGELRVYVIGSDDNHILTTYEGYISIRGRIKPDDYVDDDPENEAVRVLAEAREARDAAVEAAEQAEAAASQSAAQASIAEVYDATKTYAIGDYCLHDGQLYECTAEISTPEAWTAAHWTAATVGAELNDIQDDVSGLKEDFNDIFDKEAVPASIDEITGIVKRTGFTGGAQTSGRVGIKLTVNSNYDSYYIVTNKPIAIAFNNPTVTYLAMCVAENYTGIETDSANNLYLRGDNPQRYRKSDGTLPTLDDPLTVPAGAVISFSMKAGAMETVYGFEEKNVVKEEFANAIGEIIDTDELRPTIKYLSTVDTDIGSRGKEQLSIFLPTYNGFIKYAFVRCEYDNYNANNWRIDKCYACDNAKNVLYPITASGEWEMAIKINGAPDFIGGNAHGDEVLTAFDIFIDGVLIADVSTITEQPFDVVEIIETTLLYNPIDGATLSTRDQYTPIGTHGRKYTITCDGIQLKQEVTFDTALTLNASYMTMLPIIRGNDTVSALQITDHYYADNNYTVYDVSVGESGSPGYGWKFDVEQATIWGNDSGINATVKMLKQPMIDNMGARRFQVQDTLNGYNKLYWSVCGVGGNTYDVSQNERFVTESVYTINRR